MSHCRQRAGRRPWQVLCWAALFFGCLQVGIGLVLDSWLPDVRDPEYALKERQLRARRAEAPGRPLVVALGSSRTLLGLQAGRLGQGGQAVVYNFGVVGCGPVLEGVYLRRLLAADVRPDLLLVEVLPPALNRAGDRTLEEDWLQAARLGPAEVARLRAYHSRPASLLGRWCQARCLPCTRPQAGLRCRLGLDRPAGAWDSYGWQAYPQRGLTPAARRRMTDLAHQQYHEALGEFRLAEGPARALDDLLDRCRREGIPVALVIMPEAAEFRGFYPPGLRAGLMDYVVKLSREKGVPLIDASAWVGDAGFRDGHHLLPEGAAEFTDRFGREALGPLLRSQGLVRGAGRPPVEPRPAGG
jgi:hypothetical protein